MQLAKPALDFGLSTNTLEAMTVFWEGAAGLPLDHVLPIRRGHKQYRYDAGGSVIKVNHYVETLPEGPQSGYRELFVANDGVQKARSLTDPDGNRISIVPPDPDGVYQIGIGMAVRDLDAHRKFYENGLGFAEVTRPDGAAFRAGKTLIMLSQSDDVALDTPMQGRGWRYMTLQVFKVDDDHRKALSFGAKEQLPPTTLGTTARISLIRDPDGNLIELSQRASIVGSLD